MNYIRHSLFALAVRWPEVILICALSTLTQIAAVYVFNKNVEDADFPVGIAFLTFVTGILTILLETGFIRTFVTDFSRQQTVGNLLGVGKTFFWRFFTINILAMLAFAVTSLVLTQFFPAPEKTATTSKSFVDYLSLFLPYVIFAKFLIFIPVIVLVHNVKVFESFKKIGRYKLLIAKQVLVVYAINLVIDYLYGVLSFIQIENGFEQSGLLAIKAALVFTSQLFALLVSLTAVGLVMFVDMQYDTHQGHESTTEY